MQMSLLESQDGNIDWHVDPFGSLVAEDMHYDLFPAALGRRTA